MNSVPFQCALCDLRVVGVGPVQSVTAGYRGNTMTALNIDDCINETCPWSGKPVQADSLALYGDDVVGFCNPGCRDKFKIKGTQNLIPSPELEIQYCAIRDFV